MRFAPFTLIALLLTSPAWACGEPATISGDFQTGASGWGEPDGQFQVRGSEAVIAPAAGTQTARWYAGKTFGSLDACVTIQMPAGGEDAARGYAGLVFWGVDKDNFYQAVISRNGMVSVARKVRGKILAASPIAWMPTNALNVSPDARNALRVTLDGQTVVVLINDKEVARFRGQAPDGSSHVGLVASSSPAAVDAWRMTDFKVSESGAQVASSAASGAVAAADAAGETTGAINAAPRPECGAGKVLLEDKFAAHDPMWGAKNSQVSMGEGAAIFEPAPGTPTLRWNRAFVFGDIDACVDVELAKNTTNPTASYAGLVFWVEDSRNYHQAVIAPNGYFTVARISDGKVVAKRPVAWTKVAAVKTGAKQRNTLRLILKGPEGRVLINGQQVASFRGEPPHVPTYVGLLASSADSKNGDSWSISDLKVTAPQ